jgi:hypothetical protein
MIKSSLPLWVAASLVGCWVFQPASGLAAELQTGAAFRQALAQPVDAVSWSAKPLRGALERIVETQHVAVMLDRRIDPDQLIEFSASGLPLESLLAELAEKYGAGVSHIGSAVYIGPRETTDVLATVVQERRQQIEQLPAAAKAKLLRTSPWEWKRMTTPISLLGELETAYGVKIVGKDKMPHDLWPAVQLPPLGFAEKLSLVLAGFGVTFELSPDGGTARLVPLPKQSTLTKTYPAGANAAQLAEQFAAQFPQAKIRAQGRDLAVEGPYEVHDAIARLLAGERVRPPPQPAPSEGKKNYTLTVTNKPVGGVMIALGKQLGKEIVFDVKVERRLTNEISVSVKEVSLAELLKSVVTPAGLKYELQENKIRVFD